MAAQKTCLNIMPLLSVKTVKKYVMLNVQIKYIFLTILMTLGAAGNAVPLKNLGITLLNLIDMINTLSQTVIFLRKSINLKTS